MSGREGDGNISLSIPDGSVVKNHLPGQETWVLSTKLEADP